MKDITVIITDDSVDSWKRGRTNSDSKDPTESLFFIPQVAITPPRLQEKRM